MTVPAKQMDCGAGEDSVQDNYFLDAQLALRNALVNRQVLTSDGTLRPQICYYDGIALDDAPLNLINVPSQGFTSFFAHNSLDLPANIVGRPDMDANARADIESAFQHI